MSRTQSSVVRVGYSGSAIALPDPSPNIQSFQIQSHVSGITAVGVDLTNVSPETLALFSEAHRRGLQFAVTDVQGGSGGQRTVSFRLFERREGARNTAAVGNAITITHTLPNDPQNDTSWVSAYVSTRNTQLAAALRNHLANPEGAARDTTLVTPVVTPPRRTTPPPVPGPLEFQLLPRTDALIQQMDATGYELQVIQTPNGSAYQIFQRNVDTFRNSQNRRAVGSPFRLLLADYNDPERRDTALHRELMNRLDPTDFPWRRDTLAYLQGQVTDRFGIANVVLRSREIPSGQLLQGQENRFGDTLVTILSSEVGRPGVNITAAELQSIKMPLLHALQHIEANHPGYLQMVGAVSPDALRHFALNIAEQIVQRRTGELEVPLLQSGMQLVGFCNHENMFSDTAMTNLASRFGIRKTGNDRRVFMLKGASNSEDPAHTDTFLQWVGNVGGNTTQPTLLWLHGHGSPTEITFSSGHGARNVISYQELANALVSQGTGAVDLRHVRIALDCCHGYDFGRNLMSEIQRAAERNGRTIASFPTMITAANRGSVGWVQPYNDGSHVSTLVDTLRNSSTRNGALTLGGFIQADNTASSTFASRVRSWGIQTSSQPSSSAVYIDRQDSAVFSGEATNTLLMIQQARLSLHGRFEIPPPIQRTLPRQRNVPLELSHLNRVPDMARLYS